VGAGCVSSACPDLRRGSRATAIPTPTGPEALNDKLVYVCQEILFLATITAE